MSCGDPSENVATLTMFAPAAGTTAVAVFGSLTLELVSATEITGAQVPTLCGKVTTYLPLPAAFWLSTPGLFAFAEPFAPTTAKSFVAGSPFGPAAPVAP